MVGVQQILDSGIVDETIDTATLREAKATLEHQIQGLRDAQWGPVGQAQLTRHLALLQLIDLLLEKRYGSDGMTPLNG